MKKIIALLLCCTLIICGCGTEEKTSNKAGEITKGIATFDERSDIMEASFTGLSDPALSSYMESVIYSELVGSLNSEEYFVENIEIQYISKEYIEELSYNSKENIFFGYTLAELDEIFQTERYVFTLGNDGTTTVEEFQEYDSTFERVLKNVAIGTGVILICVTVSAVTGGLGAPAVSMIFAASAKSGTIMALSSGAIGAASAGIITGIETGSFEETIKAMLVEGSEGFKWGAISGAIEGGIVEGVTLKGATLNGLTMNEAAKIQKESKFPLDVIKQFNSMEQYNICKKAGLKPEIVNGKTALIREIDLDYIDEATGKSNLQLMKSGYAPVEPETGSKYQLHHIGQKADSTLAILTEAEHKKGGNNVIWHDLTITSAVHNGTNNWDAQRTAFWKAMGEMLDKG